MCPHRFLRLLVVEDVDDIQAVLRFSLQTVSGWQVTIAKSTQDWLTIAQKEQPDVILIDEHPNSSKRLLQLKADRLTRDIPVVCLVSRDRRTDQLRTQQEGAAATVAKPFNPLLLINIILGVVEPRSQN